MYFSTEIIPKRYCRLETFLSFFQRFLQTCKRIFCTAARKCQLSGHGAKRKLALSVRECRKKVYWPRPRKNNPSDRMFYCLSSAPPWPSISCDLRHSLFSWPSVIIYYGLIKLDRIGSNLIRSDQIQIQFYLTVKAQPQFYFICSGGSSFPLAVLVGYTEWTTSCYFLLGYPNLDACAKRVDKQ